MDLKSKQAKSIITLAGIGVLVFVFIFAGISLTKNLGKSKDVISYENAEKTLNQLYNGISIHNVTPRKAQVDLSKADIKDSLPDISKYTAQVTNTTDDFIEIFSSTEKAGKGTDGWLCDMANAFNSNEYKINGKTVSVEIRGIASGMGMDYIVSGKHVPDAFTPSNELWGKMIESEGIPITLVEKRLAGNVAGILTSKKTNNELVKKYGSVDLKAITQAVANNEMAMGYTNPFASSTGLNFLVSTLSTFDSKNPLSAGAVSEFEKFQTNIPFVAYTTLQMRDSAVSGVLDGFILEYQLYNNSPDLQSEYTFTPFGVRHDSPMYAIGNLSTMKKAILDKFIAYCKTDANQKRATEDGFNNLNSYKPSITVPAGSVITREQKLWKEKKNGANNISAVFVADVSGSMDVDDRLINLKKSLLSGSKFIGKSNSIGLVSFSNDVNINLPIAKFDLNQRALFTGAVEDMQAGGNTAMFDAITVATKMLLDEKAKNPANKLMLFVLTDGATNKGLKMDDVQGMLKALQIPIYTIGYKVNADILSSLKNLSSINEAANIDADTDDVVYKLENLFNAQM